jgi:hypothetical protein
MNIFSKFFGVTAREPEFTIGREVDRITTHGFKSVGFELCVPQGHHLESGHVRLEHRAFYTVRLSNSHSSRCDVTLNIDGKEIGTWRVPAKGVIELERPVNDTGRFTFYRLGSAGATAAGLTSTDQMGLVTATFTPEMVFKEPEIRYSQRRLDERGGTGLSGLSGQKFVNVESIRHDIRAAITIHARLVAHDHSARPLQSVGHGVPPPLP